MTERDPYTEGQQDPETKRDVNLTPPTFGQRLKEGARSFLKDFRGISLRLTVYVTEATIIFTALGSLNVSQETSTIISFGVMGASMVGGEFFVFDRISRKLPWFEISYLPYWKTWKK